MSSVMTPEMNFDVALRTLEQLPTDALRRFVQLDQAKAVHLLDAGLHQMVREFHHQAMSRITMNRKPLSSEERTAMFAVLALVSCLSKELGGSPVSFDATASALH